MLQVDVHERDTSCLDLICSFLPLKTAQFRAERPARTDFKHGIRWVSAETAGGGASEGYKNGHLCRIYTPRRLKPLFARPVRDLPAPCASQNRDSRRQQLEQAHLRAGCAGSAPQTRARRNVARGVDVLRGTRTARDIISRGRRPVMQAWGILTRFMILHSQFRLTCMTSQPAGRGRRLTQAPRCAISAGRVTLA